MPLLVVHGATLRCSCGTSPASLSVLPVREATGTEQRVATVDDFAPNVNIPPFGMCTTQANPQVAAATSAAQGVLTPQPCIPVVTAPWSPGANKTTVGERPALVAGSTATCAWTGTVDIADPATQIDVE